MHDEYRVFETRDLNTLNTYKSRWDHIAKSLDWPFAEMHWVLAAAKYLEEECRPLAIVVLRNDAFAGALLVVAGTEIHHKTLRPVGSGSLGESIVVVADNQESESHLLQHLVRRQLPFVLPRVVDSHDLESALMSARGFHGFLFNRHVSGSPVLDLRGGMKHVYQTISANRRNSVRRKLKKLRNQGSVEFEFAFPAQDDLQRYMDLFVNLEDAGWKGRQGSAIRRKPGFYDFFSNVLRDFAHERCVRFDLMNFEGKTIAIQIGLVWNKRYYLIKPTYDENLASLSPGHLLTHAAIEHSVEQELLSYEFLGSEDEWKLSWADSIRSTRTWIYYPYNYNGIRALSKHLWRKFFPDKK
jgi:CelD/BcsL family acetyltransferase involved in cellulose biosynthesis